MSRIAFPKDFVWGAATAAYQIEGACREDGRGESIWDRFSHTPGKVKDGTNGDRACDHYHRFESDVDLMAAINLQAYRFSVSWSRVMPEGRGTVNQKGLDFYCRLVDKLLEKGITPYITMYHWDLPQTLQDRGGWTNRETPEALGELTQVVARRLGDRVKHWLTLNEPQIFWGLGHVYGVHAPGQTSMLKAFKAVHNIMMGHGLALAALRQHSVSHCVGITHSLTPIYPLTAADTPAVPKAQDFMLRLFLDPILRKRYPKRVLPLLNLIGRNIRDSDMDIIGAPVDFIGVQNYTLARVKKTLIPVPGFSIADPTPGVPVTDMGWEIAPDAFYELLTWIREEYANPKIVITEGGSAFPDRLENGRVHDKERTRYLQQYLTALSRAMSEGSNIGGYFVWSLLDNFEWAEGERPRFGLYHNDYATQTRVPKDTAFWYADLIKNGFFDGSN
jgi:beta-glucosidase